MNLHEAFPEDGVSYSDQALDVLEASPWLQEVIHKALVGLVMDLMDLKRGVPLADVVGESRDALKEFSEGGMLIGVEGPGFDMMIWRRSGGYGWEVDRLIAKSSGLN